MDVIETEDLRKVYPNGVEALKGVSVRLSARVPCIIGRNGAGKTTLVRILSTQLRPTSGRARVLGLDVVADREALRRRICSIPQEARPMGVASPYEHVVMYLVARGWSMSEAKQAARRVLKDVGLGNFMDIATDELSGGMKRKVFLAMALAAQAELTFLDEPTAGLDPLSRLETWGAMRQLKSYILLTTHDMEEAQTLCEYLVLLDSGRVIAQGTLEELMRPLQGKVRVEGYGDISIGGMRISYMTPEEARGLISDGLKVTIRPVNLDDVFIINGIRPLSEDEGNGEA
ncbi:ABC-type multidrug transport system, ATPase component [Acidilobus saccharovorans 345-15]|uniref:ABC-type multidrug transport system, ATPase component n=1 Tax=Acidilobus saccharovorans (strain DSM 16705 / JCM 18335 / VKM B-2471 / 345-15) TaxID=666510 RepID=D9Q0V5_ACIS3|nr:ABC transporter ATP-binding protein [Acidilobus saccharovorans]ADL18943.1 ABC-type multidrug transport system, ATPase component [Acidilobus saccharovorans 345-15]